MRHIRIVVALFCLIGATGCATFDGVSFGLSLANADTTVSFRHGDGKTVLAAEQDGKTVRAHFRR
jgi:hypothetical protein